jgi:copper chaperone NosL
MNQHSSRPIRISILLLALTGLLIACGDTQPDSPQSTLTSMHINQQDECHLCGMLIKGFAGPKGAIQTDSKNALKKFCSSNDLFAYLLQPENVQLKKQAYVHDMSKADWQTPDDQAFVQVEEAWYVIGHRLNGAMGPTIASFTSQQSAEQFIQQHQGKLIRFGEINLELLNSLSQQMHSMDHMHH